jgi:membrane fusion protein (multidrug efflux system)
MNQWSSEHLPPAPVPFKSTLQSLEMDNARDRRVAATLIVAAAIAWGFWAVIARIPIYATSDHARLESQQSTYRIAPAVDGHISRADLQLGQTVHKGQILIELDSTTPRNALEEGITRVAALQRDVTALDRQVQAEMRTFEADRARQAVSIAEAGAAADEAVAQLESARRQSDDLAKLRAAGIAADANASAAAQEAKARLAHVTTLDLGRQRLETTRTVSAAEAQSRLAALQAQRTRLQGDVALAQRAIAQLQHEIELRRVVAPVSGRIGELQNVHVGTFVGAGSGLGTVVPDESLRIVADLSPDLMTRVRAGEPARFRYDGFSTLTHGSVAAIVTRTGTEVRDGTFEVILAPVVGGTTPKIPLTHGLRGSIDIEVERLSPLDLLLRRAGELSEPRGPRPTATAARGTAGPPQ